MILFACKFNLWNVRQSSRQRIISSYLITKQNKILNNAELPHFHYLQVARLKPYLLQNLYWLTDSSGKYSMQYSPTVYFGDSLIKLIVTMI